jgi:hypothetical protein
MGLGKAMGESRLRLAKCVCLNAAQSWKDLPHRWDRPRQCPIIAMQHKQF